MQQLIGKSCLILISLISLNNCSENNMQRMKTMSGKAANDLSFSNPSGEKSSGASEKLGEPSEKEANATEIDPDMENNTVASEPASIGGAYLTCLYPETVQQNAPEINMACQLNGTRGLAYASVETSFQKIDEEGRRYPLTVTSYNKAESSWTLKESTTTLFINRVEARVTVNNATPVVFTATIIAPVSLAINRMYWLFNEPDNDNGVERYAEFGSAGEVAVYQTMFGGTNGPLGRLNDNDESKVRPFLCRSVLNKTPKWVLSSLRSTFNDYPKACPAGYRFALPMSDAEVLEVQPLVDGMTLNTDGKAYVWVALTDKHKPGTFQIILK